LHSQTQKEEEKRRKCRRQGWSESRTV
jgi:hypothetical protein